MTTSAKSPFDEALRGRALMRSARLAMLLGVLLLTACQDDATRCGQSADVAACTRACSAGELGDHGCAKLGDLYAEGRGVWNSPIIAAMFHERACKGGERRSCERLAALSEALSAPSARPQERDERHEVATPVASAAPAAKGAEESLSVACLRPDVEQPLAIELPEALKAIEARCEAGDGGSCATLADRLQQGVSVARDAARAARLYERGCDQHDVQSCRKMGQALEQGVGAQRNTTLASQFYQRACMAGQMAGCTSLGELALSRAAGAPSPMAGIGNLQRACDRAYPPACVSLAATARDGAFGPPNPQLAERLMARANELFGDLCGRGTAEACLALGENKEFPAPELGKPGSGPRATSEAELSAAEAAYRKACDAGLGRGCVSLARFLLEASRGEDAKGVEARLARGCAEDDALFCQAWLSLPPQDPSPPALQRACAGNFAEACAQLAELAGRDGSLGEPSALLDRACQLGSSVACGRRLGSGQLQGEAAIPLRREACRRGDGEQCAQLAKLHLDGPFEPKDLSCARALFEQSCAATAHPRSVEGCERAAQMARDGQGGPRDDALANQLALAAVSAQPSPGGLPSGAAAPASAPSTASPTAPTLSASSPSARVALPPLPAPPAEPPIAACSIRSQTPARTTGPSSLLLMTAGLFAAFGLGVRRSR